MPNSRHLLICFLSLVLSFFLPNVSNVYAQSFIETDRVLEEALRAQPLTWALIVGVGYSQYQDLYRDDGNTVLGKIGISKELAQLGWLHLGMMIGVQSGNTGRLNVPQDTLDLLGSLPIESTFKPALDLLLTAKFYFVSHSAVYIEMKGGGILRRWQFTRTSVNDLTRVSPETQIGFGMDINRFFSISLLYQRIFGGNPNFKVNIENETGRVSAIPSVESLLLDLSVHFAEGFM